MLRQRNLLGGGLIAAGAALLVAGSAAAAADAPASRTLPRGECFSVHDWRGWSSPSPDVLYLKVRNRDVYRVDLHGGPRLDSPGNFLVSRHRGPTRVCSTLDLDLAVADSFGYRSHLFPTAISKLTPEQVAALPPRHRP